MANSFTDSFTAIHCSISVCHQVNHFLVKESNLTVQAFVLFIKESATLVKVSDFAAKRDLLMIWNYTLEDTKYPPRKRVAFPHPFYLSLTSVFVQLFFFLFCNTSSRQCLARLFQFHSSLMVGTLGLNKNLGTPRMFGYANHTTYYMIMIKLLFYKLNWSNMILPWIIIWRSC